MRGSGRRTLALSVGVGLIGLVGPSSAGAATQIGQTFTPDVCDDVSTFLQSGSPGGQYAAPFAGVITSWSFQAPASPPQLKFKVARPAGGNDFTIVGEEGPRTPTASALNTYPARIAVQAGDVIGFSNFTSGACERELVPGYTVHRTIGDVPPGTTATFTPFSGLQLDVSATLEPDCDSDGFGDETQDPSLLSCPPAPETTITAGPKDKSRNKSATFSFASDDPDASFSCTLDGQQQFKACTSPLTIRVKKGKHTFSVQATDQGGNADGSPASDDWKVKKKK